jgi:hypothetical protein
MDDDAAESLVVPWGFNASLCELFSSEVVSHAKDNFLSRFSPFLVNIL